MINKKQVFSKNKIKNNIPQSELKGLILLTGLLTAGFIFGAGTAGKSDTVLFSGLYEIVRPLESNVVFTEALSDSLPLKILIIIISYISGLSCIGIPVMLILPLLQGLIYGFEAGYFYSIGDSGKIVYYILAVLPTAVIFSVLLIIVCNSGASMSYNVIKSVSGKTPSENRILSSYTKKFCIIIGAVIITVLAESGMKAAFSGLFLV